MAGVFCPTIDRRFDHDDLFHVLHSRNELKSFPGDGTGSFIVSCLGGMDFGKPVVAGKILEVGVEFFERWAVDVGVCRCHEIEASLFADFIGLINKGGELRWCAVGSHTVRLRSG